MTSVRDAVESLLASKPEIESDLEQIVETDTQQETWTFDDIPADSGLFGELVSRGIVEKANGEYRLADREAVVAVVGTDIAGESKGSNLSDGSGQPGLLVGQNLSKVPDVRSAFSFDKKRGALLGLALAVVLIFRSYVFPQVYREEHIVFLGNDPWFYRYWIREQALANAPAFSVPEGIKFGEPLLVSLIWGLTSLLGGGKQLGFGILAWYPVVAALITAILVYLIAVHLTDDHRIGLASVVLLGVTPIHAYRTALGFSDHHAFDALWLALTVFAMVRLVDLKREFGKAGKTDEPQWISGSELGWAALLGVAIAGQTLAWQAGPLLLVPIALFGLVWVLIALSGDVDVVRSLLYPTVGSVIGGILSVVGFVVLGWQTEFVVAAPMMLAGGMVTLTAIALVIRRVGVSDRLGQGAVVGTGIGVTGLIFVLYPAFRNELIAEISQLVLKTGQGEITEVQGMFASDYGFIFAPAFFFGFALFFAIPYIFWGGWKGVKQSHPGWILLGIYGVFFLILGIIRVRFATHLAVIGSIFAGIAFVHLVAVVGEVKRPRVLGDSESGSPESGGVLRGGSSRSGAINSEHGGGKRDAIPDRSVLVVVIGIFVLIGGMGTLMTPLQMNFLTYSDSQYETAVFMEQYAEEQGWEYPENYVFSRWGDNRMYNGIVNGETRGYGYARNHFEEFLNAPVREENQWFYNLDNRAGFIVIDGGLSESSRGTISSELQENYWRSDDQDSISHFQPLMLTSGGEKTVFTPVKGARITGHGKEGESYSVTSTIDLGGEKRTWSRKFSARYEGIYSVTIPVPGDYTVGNEAITVSESDVHKGTIFENFDGEGIAYWKFDSGEGKVANDMEGGHHGRVYGAEWGDGIRNTGLHFGSGRSYIAFPISIDSMAEFTISGWVKLSTKRSGAIMSTGKDGYSGSHEGILLDHGLSDSSSDRFGLYLGNGNKNVMSYSPALDFDYPTKKYHHVAVAFNRGNVTWYIDGRKVKQESVEIRKIDHKDSYSAFIGREYSSLAGFDYFNGSLDEFRICDKHLDETKIAELSKRDEN